MLDLDLSVLDERAARARVAFIVEMDHFVREKYDFRLRCIDYLASRGWTVFGEEIDRRLGDRYDAYLRTGDESQLDPIDEPPWFTAGVLAGGMARQPTAQLDAEQRAFLRRVRDVAPTARWFGFDLDRDETYLELANAATTFEELRPAMALRERRMHERVAEVLDADPSAKVALMAGSLHLLKDDRTVDAPGVGAGPGGDTDPSLGHFVTHDLVAGPDEVLSLWMLHGRGRSASPWLPPPGDLAAVPGTVDAALAAAHDEPTLVVVDPADTERRRVTQMHGLVLTCRLPEQVDALVFVPEVSPLREPGDPTLHR